MKQFLKFLSTFLVCTFVGLSVVLIGILVFTDTTLSELKEIYTNAGIIKIFLSCITSISALAIAACLQIIVHEAGHLIAGLWCKFKFVSFRVAHLTLIKEEGKYKIKKFHIAGTGGQCLLSPPTETASKKAVIGYLAGGAVLNLASAIIFFIVWLKADHLFLNFFAMYMWVIGLIFALLNGIPLKAGGITNDGYNIRLISKDEESKQSILNQLYINAACQQGTRPRDMPEEWFKDSEVNDYKNIFQVSERLTFASRLIDKREYDSAYAMLNDLHHHSKNIIAVLANEIDCELPYLELCQRKHLTRADELYNSVLRKYVEQASQTMSSKQRLLCAWALFKENDIEAATAIYQKVACKKGSYLMQGEVDSDIDLMGGMLSISPSMDGLQ